MKALRVPPMYRCIGLVDADLLDNGSRHPNLALLKIAGFLSDNGIMFELILDSQADICRYDRIYLSNRFPRSGKWEVNIPLNSVVEVV